LPWLNAGASTARQHSVSRDAALIALRERAFDRPIRLFMTRPNRGTLPKRKDRM